MKLRVKSRKDIDKILYNYEFTGSGYRCPTGGYFNQKMFELCGKEIEVELKGYGSYKYSTRGWAWLEEWLEPAQVLYLGGE